MKRKIKFAAGITAAGALTLVIIPGLRPALVAVERSQTAVQLI